MRHIGLTGNIASGKSTVAALFRRWGLTVLDADAIVRELQQPGTAVFAAITEAFGPGVVAADGTLDRAALRARITADDAARRMLEALVHPAVEARRQAQLREAAARGECAVVSEIPLLFEVMDPARFDGIVLVDAPEGVRAERLVATRGIAADEARRLIALQQPARLKRARSTWIIDNDRDAAALERRSREVFAAIAGHPAPA